MLERLRERFLADPGDARAFSELEEHWFVAGSWDDLLWLYQHRLTAPALAKDPRQRAGLLFRLGQILADRRGDPDAAARGTTAVVDADVYQAAMAVDPPPADPAGNPGARRTGAFQHCYAWLQDDYWPSAERDRTTLFSRAQTFWARFGSG